jgi:hypothetical protein
MKRIIFLFTIICIFNTVQAGEQSDFRNARWGMTPDEVIKSEGTQFFFSFTLDETKSGHTILSAPLEYTEGFDSLLSYVFKDNRLISTSYWFLPTNRFKFDYTKELFSNDYKVIQEHLEKQYGKPDKVIGEYKCMWNKEKTVIIHLLKEQYGNTSHGIIFYDAGVWKSMGENSALLNP